ncbi:MAG: hypothetical protein U5L11_07790 [Arhodomonas sp.]|nr:hypothetical protein [Arhodomonas sp.]
MINTVKLLPALIALTLLAACAGTVVAPEPAQVDNPRPVFLVDHGRHISLVLARPDGSMIRYLYGDWRWYALQETGLCRAFPTLFTETQGTLARQALQGPPVPSSIQRQVPVVIQRIHPLQAPVTRVDRLACTTECTLSLGDRDPALQSLLRSRVRP